MVEKELEFILPTSNRRLSPPYQVADRRTEGIHWILELNFWRKALPGLGTKKNHQKKPMTNANLKQGHPGISEEDLEL